MKKTFQVTTEEPYTCWVYTTYTVEAKDEEEAERIVLEDHPCEDESCEEDFSSIGDEVVVKVVDVTEE